MTSTHSEDYQFLLRRLREARLAAGLTQNAVAVSLKVPQSQVSKIESGERRIDVIELKRLARIYSCEISFFFKGIDDDL